MRKSEIFESFIKIAEEKGMISLDAPDKAKKILENNPRHDSLDLKDIEKLYNVKPDAPKDMQYKKNIMEDAHPDSVIVAPSYDKLNGLVENNNERQNIILNILDRPPTGLLTNRKYAENELLMSLVRVANDLDNRDIDDLRSLADACLLQVTPKPLKKVGFLGFLANPWVLGTTVLLGGLYLQQHLPMVNRGFEQNHQQLISEIDDLLNSSTAGVMGKNYKGNFVSMLTDFKAKLNHFYDSYENNIKVINQVETPKDGKELAEIAKDTGLTDKVKQAFDSLNAEFKNLYSYLMTIQKDFSSQDYKSRQIQDEGVVDQLMDKVPFLQGGKGLVADDFDDVNRALTPYVKSVQDVLGVFQQAESYQETAQKELADASTATEPQAESSPAAEADKGAEDLESNDFMKNLVDR